MRRQLLLTVLLALVSCKAPPKPKQGVYVGRLGQIVANPKGSAPSSTKDDKEQTTYTFADTPGVTAIVVTVAKDRPGAWHLAMQAAPGQNFLPGNLASTTGESLPHEWFDLADGPLKGDVAHLPGSIGSLGDPGGRCTKADLFSPQFFLSKPFAFADRDMMKWACESGRAGVKAIAVTDFLDQCRAAVRAKLAAPESADFHAVGIEHEVLVSAECEYGWKSDVTSKNGFGADVSHGFNCSYAPKKGHVEASLFAR